jgi:hypothetical protein
MQSTKAHLSNLIQSSFRMVRSISHEPTVLLDYPWGVCVVKNYGKNENRQEHYTLEDSISKKSF